MSTNPTRRTLLAGAGAAAVQPGVSAPAETATGPDAALVALCHDFAETDRRVCDLMAEGDRIFGSPEHGTVWAQVRALAYNSDRRKAIAEMQATTLAGLGAKAEAIAQEWSDAVPRDDDMVSLNRFIASLPSADRCLVRAYPPLR